LFCTSLESVTIPTSVTTIGESAFSYCNKLKSVIIPTSVTSIDKETFWMCTSLISVTIPTSVIAIGNSAGTFDQSNNSVAIGSSAGYSGQSNFAVAIGSNAGQATQGINAIAIGQFAGQTNQGSGAVAIGYQAGSTGQATNAIAIGANAGQTNQATNAIAIGQFAGQTNQGARSIVINASGTAFASATTDACFIRPLRALAAATAVYYSASTFELSYLTSSVTTKNTIQDLTLDTSIIDNLSPKTYFYNMDPSAGIQVGYIAEEVQALSKHFATYDTPGGDPVAINYNTIVEAALGTIKKLCRNCNKIKQQ
jgi:hypothetical protein